MRVNRLTPLLLSFIFILAIYSTFGQEVQRKTISYTPSSYGYELSIPLAWKFINCYGEVHVTITKNSKDITSNAYIYNGVRYTSADLGSEAFVKPECGLTDISADVYNQSYRLGNIKMGNVIDWLGGCFGQTYHAMKLLGLNDADYKDKLADLSLSNIRLDEVYSRDYSLEGKIKEIEKQKNVTSTTSEADDALARGDLEEAQALYKKVVKLDYANSHAKAKLEEIKTRLKENANQEEVQNLLKQAEELEESGDKKSAKSAYEDVLKKDPDNEKSKEKIKELGEQIEAEKTNEEKRQDAVSAASNRNHSGSFWGMNHGSDSYGSATQAAHLIGYFRLDYNIWSLSGEPAHKFKFYWEWANSLKTGYPQWVSVLHDEVVMIAELKKYPDLMNRWNNIKPLYIEVECDVLYYKNGEEYVAHQGTIHVVPEVLGHSGQEVNWSLPSSSNWDELFTYCNNLDWVFFEKIGVEDEIKEYADKFSTGIAWPKYTFEHSDQINFYQSHGYFHTEYKEWVDTEGYSSSADITKVVWPVEDIQAIIKEYEEREKESEEETMDSEDFWNTPESDKKNTNTEFWDSPENKTTTADMTRKNQNAELNRLVSGWSTIIKQRREKYAALQNPFSIEAPLDNSTHTKNVVKVEGSINRYFQSYSNEVYLNLNGVRQQVDISSSGRFSNPMVLSNGYNDIKLELQGNGFTIIKPLRIKYEGVETDIRATLTWNTSGSDLDLHIKGPNSTCSHSRRNTQTMSLDVDDTNGYGPENISVVDGRTGNYSIQVQNYSGGNGAQATLYIYVNEVLKETLTHTFYSSKEFWNASSVYLNP